MAHGDESGSDAQYLAPYAEAVRTHGAGFAATLWGSRHAQHARFAAMHDLLDLRGRHLVDLGCGDGALAGWLAEQGIEVAGYVGLDAMAPMIEAARERGIPRCRFEVADVVARPEILDDIRCDVVCCSGMLNTMDDATAQRVIQSAWDRARVAVLFNFLSDRPHADWKDRPLAPARRFSTVGWLDWALARTARVRFDQSYLEGHDATLLMGQESVDLAELNGPGHCEEIEGPATSGADPFGPV